MVLVVVLRWSLHHEGFVVVFDDVVECELKMP